MVFAGEHEFPVALYSMFFGDADDLHEIVHFLRHEVDYPIDAFSDLIGGDVDDFNVVEQGYAFLLAGIEVARR